MAERSGRRVHVSFSGRDTKITLAWFEPSSEGGRGFNIKDLHYCTDGVMPSVDKALDILVPEWSRVFTASSTHSVISCELDKDPELFDAITQAEEPEQFFVSRNVLEYHSGESAAMRLWEIDFMKQYAPLIEFNKQHGANLRKAF